MPSTTSVSVAAVPPAPALRDELIGIRELLEPPPGGSV
jgi:hypothetical protein